MTITVTTDSKLMPTTPTMIGWNRITPLISHPITKRFATDKFNCLPKVFACIDWRRGSGMPWKCCCFWHVILWQMLPHRTWCPKSGGLDFLKWHDETHWYGLSYSLYNADSQYFLLAGSTVYTCMLNCHGKTEADLTVSMVDSGDGAPHAPKLDGGQNCYYRIFYRLFNLTLLSPC